MLEAHHRGHGWPRGRDVDNYVSTLGHKDRDTKARSRRSRTIAACYVFCASQVETSHIFARYILSRSLVFVAVILPVLAPAQSTAPQLTANPIFEKHCAKCHGKTAEGRHFGGPSLLSGK